MNTNEALSYTISTIGAFIMAIATTGAARFLTGDTLVALLTGIAAFVGILTLLVVIIRSKPVIITDMGVDMQ